MKRFLKDFGFFFLGFFLFNYYYYNLVYGLRMPSHFIYNSLETLFYAIPCYLVFLLSIRMLKSNTAFVSLSFLLFLLYYWSDIHATRDINLTFKVMGRWASLDGDMTAFGYFFGLFERPFIMFSASVILFVKDLLRNQKIRPAQTI